MAIDIDNVSISDDARTLIDLMTAAFTGDVNEALAEARKAGGGHSVLSWTHGQLLGAWQALVDSGCLEPSAPPPIPREPRSPRAGEPTTREIAQAIERLRDLLFRQYDGDFSFAINGRGAIIAAAGARPGVVEAVTRESEAREPPATPVKYLDPERVTRTRQTEPPQNRSHTGYGSKLPSSWLLQLDGARWYRVYTVCWSNVGSAYVVVAGERLFLGSYDPGATP